jgi:hypothetical protein
MSPDVVSCRSRVSDGRRVNTTRHVTSRSDATCHRLDLHAICRRPVAPAVISRDAGFALFEEYAGKVERHLLAALALLELRFTMYGVRDGRPVFS